MSYEEENVSGGLSLKVWLRLLRYLKQMKKQAVYSLIIIVVAIAFTTAFPLFTRYAVNNFVVPETTKGLVPFAVVYAAFILLVGVLSYFWVKLIMNIEMDMSLMIRRDCFVHLQKLQIAYHNVNSVGYLIGGVMSDTERIGSMMSWGLSAMIEAALVIIFSITYMLILSPPLAVILILIIPTAGLIAWFFQGKIIVVSRKVRELNSRITGSYNEGITGSKTSKTLVIEDINSEEFSKLSDNMHRESVRNSRLTAIMMPMVMSLGSIGVGFILYRGGMLERRDLLDYGILSAFITYAVSTIEPIVWVSGVISEMVSAQVGIERVTGLLGEPVTITDLR